MRNLLTWLIPLLAACGSIDGGSGGSGETNIVAQGEETPKDEAKPENQYAMLVQDAAALPACDANMEGRLAYVKADATFQVCASSAWSVIDIKATAGAAGVNGEKGEKGDRGEKGEPGEVKYVDGEYWDDLITGLHWRLAGVGPNCPSGWRVPTFGEIGTASINGIFVVLGSGKIAAYELAWSSTEVDGVGRLRWNFATGNRYNKPDGAAQPESVGTPTGAYCVKVDAP